MVREYVTRPRRVGVNAHGRLFAGGVAPIPCTIADVSATGCRILARNLGPLPSEVNLTFLGIGIVAHCEVVWQRAHTAGLRILEQKPAMHDEGVTFDEERQREEANALRDRVLYAEKDKVTRAERGTTADE